MGSEAGPPHLDFGSILDSIGKSGTEAKWRASAGRALEELLDALRNQANLRPTGQYFASWEIKRAVRESFYIYVDDQVPSSFDKLVVIGGLPRTGTTFLHRLLAATGDVAVVRHWQTLGPARAGRNRGALREEANWRLSLLDRMSPRLRQIHPLDIDEPDEDNALLLSTLRSPQFGVMFRVPSYLSWLESTYGDNDVAALHRCISLLGPETTKPWVLKSPFHLGRYRRIAALAENTVFIEISRDPQQAMSSWCSLVVSARQPFSSRLDRALIESEWVTFWSRAAERALSEMQEGTAPILRINYESLRQDPIQAVRVLRSELGLPHSSSEPDSVKTWLGGGTARQQRHQYELVDYDSNLFSPLVTYAEQQSRSCLV